MPDGIFRGKKMEDVPAEFLLKGFYANRQSPQVAHYVNDNLKELEKLTRKNIANGQRTKSHKRSQ